MSTEEPRPESTPTTTDETSPHPPAQTQPDTQLDTRPAAQPDTRADAGPEAPAEPGAGLTDKGRIQGTRVSSWWVGLIVAAVLLIALLIFIAQNQDTVTIRYFGLEGQAPLAIALLIAAIGGILLVAIPGTARIMQLRRSVKKNAGSRAKRKH